MESLLLFISVIAAVAVIIGTIWFVKKKPDPKVNKEGKRLNEELEKETKVQKDSPDL